MGRATCIIMSFTLQCSADCSVSRVHRGSTSLRITELGILFRQDLLVLAGFLSTPEPPASSLQSQFNRIDHIWTTVAAKKHPQCMVDISCFVQEHENKADHSLPNLPGPQARRRSPIPRLNQPPLIIYVVRWKAPGLFSVYIPRTIVRRVSSRRRFRPLSAHVTEAKAQEGVPAVYCIQRDSSDEHCSAIEDQEYWPCEDTRATGLAMPSPQPC